jgi:two-component system, OmpR family, sensor histidine kinase MprB
VLDTPFASPRRLGFQARLTLVAGLAVAATVAIVAVPVYLVVQSELAIPLDDTLRTQAAGTRLVYDRASGRVVVDVPQVPLGGASGYAQVLDSRGKPLQSLNNSTPLPIADGDLRVVRGDDTENPPHDAYVGSVHVRIYTTRVVGGTFGLEGAPYTVQVALPRAEVDKNLNALRLVFGVVAAGGIGLAALLGGLIAQAGLRPIFRLRQAVDHVTETSDMSQRVPYEGEDELGRLGSHFNRMLGALDESLRTQRQLVADASHELRTPLASLRTNIEVLQRSPDLPAPERDRLLRDVVSQVEQLTRLIQDLIDLARGDQAPQEAEEVRLDWIVAEAVRRAATNWPAVTFRTDLAESVVVGQAGRLERAISNLLDNAGKWSPPGQLVDVRVTDHQVTVRDHGPGIERADLPYVFDRFWRAPAARALPGSGLGLAIVRQVAEAHGGSVSAELPPDGGTLMRLRLPDRGLAPFPRAERPRAEVS